MTLRRFTFAALLAVVPVLTPIVARAQGSTAHTRAASFHDHTPRIHDRAPHPHINSSSARS